MITACSGPELLAAGGVGLSQIVLAIYLLGLLALAVFGYLRSQASEEDFYLAGRDQGLLTTSLTIMATFFSSAALLGVPGWVYRDGVAPMLFALNLPLAGAAIYVFGARFARLGRRFGYVTPADLVCDYYGQTVLLRLLVAGVGFLYVLPYVVMQLQAGGYLAARLFPAAEPLHWAGREWDTFQLGATALGLLTMLYVLLGGMRCVAWTDVVQGGLLLGGMLLAGVATVFAMGGPSGYFRSVASLPREALSVPGPTGSWTPLRLFTICLFASLASMIQPGQWMRYYAARSTQTLRRSAVIFSVVLPSCFLFGVMLVALGARVLYPPTTGPQGVLPHPLLGNRPADVDQAVILMMQQQIPELLGAVGSCLVSVLMVAILAASMSTADSNLHALSALLTRDTYDQFIRPSGSPREQAWVGRMVIVVTTLLALTLVHAGRRQEGWEPLQMIGQMSLVAMAYSCQLLPAVLDMLFVRRGTRAGLVCGLLAGVGVVTLFLPLGSLIGGAGGEALASRTDWLRQQIDIGCCGFLVNVLVFAAVSRITTNGETQRRRQMWQVMDGTKTSHP